MTTLAELGNQKFVQYETSRYFPGILTRSYRKKIKHYFRDGGNVGVTYYDY